MFFFLRCLVLLVCVLVGGHRLGLLITLARVNGSIGCV